MYTRSALQRIVVSASCAAIIHFSDETVTVSEANWNDPPVIECKQKGKDASPLSKYAASKILAEKGLSAPFHQNFFVSDAVPEAAWEFYEQHRSEINWDICTINPPYVFGVSADDMLHFERDYNFVS